MDVSVVAEFGSKSTFSSQTIKTRNESKFSNTLGCFDTKKSIVKNDNIDYTVLKKFKTFYKN